MEASLGNMQTKIYLFWRFLKLAGLGGLQKGQSDFILVSEIWFGRRMTLTLSEWHEVKVDENLCVGPALNSTGVKFLIKDHNF